MEDRPPAKEDVSPAKAVLLGALAPGVNGPTWNALKMAFVMLGGSLAVMMGLAFSSSDSWLTLHVSFLVMITLALFLLLSWKPIKDLLELFNVVGFLVSERMRSQNTVGGYGETRRVKKNQVWVCLIGRPPGAANASEIDSRFLAQTGLVSVDSQMQDLNLVPNDQTEKEKVH